MEPGRTPHPTRFLPRGSCRRHSPRAGSAGPRGGLLSRRVWVMSEAEAWEQVLPWSLRALTLWPPGARAADGSAGLEFSFHVRSLRLAAGPRGGAPQELSEAALQGGRTWGPLACGSVEPGTALFSWLDHRQLSRKFRSE